MTTLKKNKKSNI